MPETPATNDESAKAGVGRRTAIKTAAAAGVSAIVWAEPTIKGLARRPAYAATGSAGGSPVSVTITGDIDPSGNITNLMVDPPAINGISTSVTYQGSPGNTPRLKLTAEPALLYDSNTVPTVDPTSALAFTSPPYSGNEKRLKLDLSSLPPVTTMFTITTAMYCT